MRTWPNRVSVVPKRRCPRRMSKNIARSSSCRRAVPCQPRRGCAQNLRGCVGCAIARPSCAVGCALVASCCWFVSRISTGTAKRNPRHRQRSQRPHATLHRPPDRKRPVASWTIGSHRYRGRLLGVSFSPFGVFHRQEAIVTSVEESDGSAVYRELKLTCDGQQWDVSELEHRSVSSMGLGEIRLIGDSSEVGRVPRPARSPR